MSTEGVVKLLKNLNLSKALGPDELLKSKLFGYGIDGKILRWIDNFFAIEHNELL